MTVGLMLGGGAPNLTLMSGALAALDEKGVEFSVVSTSGAGMVIGLLYAAPRGMTRQEALSRTREMGVSDSLYGMFPVNFKVFHKPGAMAQQYTQLMQKMSALQMRSMMPTGNPSGEHLFNDWMQLMFAAMCPSDLGPMSKGLCEPAPWIEEVVDFSELRRYPGDFYLNAYNVTDERMEIFGKDEITVDHFHAGLAFPFIYSPFKMNGKTYIEGSAIDTLNYRGLLEKKRPKLKTVVVFDVLGADKLIREPRNLYDAWVRSIIVPLVQLAKDDTRLFELEHNKKHKLNVLKVPFDIPESHWPYVLDWSRSNLDTLYEIGYDSAMRFHAEHEAELAG